MHALSTVYLLKIEPNTFLQAIYQTRIAGFSPIKKCHTFFMPESFFTIELVIYMWRTEGVCPC